MNLELIFFFPPWRRRFFYAGLSSSSFKQLERIQGSEEQRVHLSIMYVTREKAKFPREKRKRDAAT